MNRYYYDFHIHSCLSPCGDNDMTPNNIAGMATLCELNIVALTDHNSCKNCPAFYKAARRNGIIPIAGMELTTAEDIHVVCLFEKLEGAMAFDEEICSRRILIENNERIFGQQLILDENDKQIGTEPYLLINATDISLEEVPDIVAKYDGVCFPAHIDRDSNGVIATLGTFPEMPYFGIAELRDIEKLPELREKFPILEGKLITAGSDAHYLTGMRDKNMYFDLDDEPFSSDKVRSSLFALLRGR
ncbi:MAG: PHP domain-containing protein [Clostridia bacterium]|nr:PHP domain-containing protein [Clostridia bacterium]